MNLLIPHPSGSLEIRPVRADELEQVLEVYRQCEDFLALGPVASASMAMVISDLELSKNLGSTFCGIYTITGEMIGVLDIVASGYEGVRQHAYLSLLMIARDFRSHGIGQAVFEAVEAEIRKDPLVSVLLAGVQANNPQAIKFWQRMGFEITSGLRLMPDQTTCYDLRKDLA